MTDDLLKTREVAKKLGISDATVLRLYRQGDLPGFRIGSNVLRFDPAEIDGWLRGKRDTLDGPEHRSQ